MDSKRKSRFEIKQQLGEGSFSKIFKAYDRVYNKAIALKVEKEDKSKKILKFEFDVLKDLQDIPSIPKVYEFVENSNLNFIVLELLGKNISEHKKSKGTSFTNICAYNILIQMLNSIELVHEKGYIHRDIKPSNFVICLEEKNVYLVDFGLAKIHLNKNKEPFTQRKNTDFRGTIAYASMNAHNKIDLSRRDDLWSFFFVILDLLNEKLPWRNFSDDKKQIENVKRETLENAEELLLINNPNRKELFEIFNHIKSLKFSDKPDYKLIRNVLQSLLNLELVIMTISQEKNFVSQMSTNKSIYLPFNNILQNNLLFNNFNNELCMLYPMYLNELLMQMNHITDKFLLQIPKLNDLINVNNILGKKRGRSREDDEFENFSKSVTKDNQNIITNHIGNTYFGLINNTALSMNMNTCNIDNQYSNLMDEMFFKIFMCSNIPSSSYSCLGQNIFKPNDDVLSRPVYQNIKN